MTYGNQKDLHLDGIYASSHDPFVPSVFFYDPESAFCLYGAILAKKCPMDTFQIVHDLPVHGGKLPIDPYCPVLVSFFTFYGEWAAGAVLALVYFLLPAVGISL